MSSVNKRSTTSKKLHKKPSDTEHSKTRVLLFFSTNVSFVLFWKKKKKKKKKQWYHCLSIAAAADVAIFATCGRTSLVRKGPGPSTIPKNRVARKTAVPNFFPPDQKFRRKKSSAKAFRFRPEMDRTDNGRSNQLNRRPRVGRDGREVLPEFGRFEKNGGRIYF